MADLNPNFDLRESDRRHYEAMRQFSAALLGRLRDHHPRIVAALTSLPGAQTQATTQTQKDKAP